MALEKSVLLELPGALKAAEVDEKIRPPPRPQRRRCARCSQAQSAPLTRTRLKITYTTPRDVTSRDAEIRAATVLSETLYQAQQLIVDLVMTD
jgi:hypothetical protein